MLKAIIQTKNISFWIIVHALVGIGSSFSSVIFAAWFFLFLASSLSFISEGNLISKRINLLYLISYFASSELIVRMSKGYQYKIPWEFGKYTMLFGFLFGIVAFRARRGTLGIVLVLLLLPALLISEHNTTEYRELVANIFGPIAIGFSVLYCTKLAINKKQIITLLKLILLPCVSVLTFTLIRNPDFTDYTFELGANFKTAGGFGSNQVSTVLGLGTLLVFIFWINKWELFKNRNATLVLLFLFGIQGLLTFSRGGMIGAMVSIIAISYMYIKTSGKKIKIYKIPSIGKFAIGSAFALVTIFMVANSITGGVLELRYAGETNTTLRGDAEKDLNTLTTNRYDIFVADMNLWNEYFIFGSGVGSSMYMREFQYGQGGGVGVAAHVELSRLLAEHGVFGLTYFIILLVLGVKTYNNRGNPKYTALLLSFYILALYTTFHAATRTFLSPLLFGLSQLRIVDIKEPE